MFSGSIIIYNIPNGGNNKSVAFIELVDSKIDNFKSQVADLFKSNGWNIITTRFQKSGSTIQLTFDQMNSQDFVFSTVNVYLMINY